jgi:hypothetical protein
MNSTASPYHHHPHHHHPYAGYRFENTTRFYPQQSATPTEETFDDEDQIPTVEEFRAIIDDYLNNLSPKKRDKALVDQQRYLLIQQVLRDPRNTAISTAQFRFWVKKMFQLQPGTTDLVCHDNKPVAMKEQIYHILVHAHREAHHGGRDKTSALVKTHYFSIKKIYSNTLFLKKIRSEDVFHGFQKNWLLDSFDIAHFVLPVVTVDIALAPSCQNQALVVVDMQDMDAPLTQQQLQVCL